MGDVPAPKEINAQSALDQLRMLEKYGAISDNDTLEKRLMLLLALFRCVEEPTVDALYKQLTITRDYYKKPP